jgi:hypothetical protein
MMSRRWAKGLAALTFVGATLGAPCAALAAAHQTITLSEEQAILYAEGDIEALLPHDKAKAGDLRARYLVAFAWLAGRTRSIDEAQAKAYLTQAADGGRPEALSMMALLLYDGKLFPRDERRAFDLGRVAADKGDAQGQGVVAGAYDRGTGVARDPVEALKWYLISACQGMDYEAEVAALRRQLGAPQQRQAYERVFAWKRLHPDVAPLRIEQPLAEAERASRRTTREITWKPAEPGQVFDTKLSGVPWWPAGKPRPACAKGHPLSFLAQVRLRDVPGFDTADPLLMSFHYCDPCSPWGNGEQPDAYDLSLFSERDAASPDRLGMVGPSLTAAALPVFTSQDDYMSIGDVWETPLGRADFDAGQAHVIDIAKYGNPGGASDEASLHEAFGSKLGGWPSWEQSAAWPTCRDKQKMLFVGQLDSTLSSGLLWGGGGYAYLFVCPSSCKQREGELVIQTS